MAYPDSEHAANMIGTKLAANSSFTTALGSSSHIFFDAVPNATTTQFPCFNGRWLSGNDLNTLNNEYRLISRLTLLAVIVAIGGLSDNNLNAANYMDAVLVAQRGISHSYASSTRGYNVWREQAYPARRVVGQAGEIYYEVGGIYTVEIIP